MEIESNIEDKIEEDEIELRRVILKKDCGDYFKAVDYQGKKYRVMKNEVTKKYKVGQDDTLYFYTRKRGKIIKLKFYIAISEEKFSKLKKGNEINGEDLLYEKI